MKKEIIKTTKFNTKSPAGLTAAIGSLKGSKADYVPVSPGFLIELFEEVLGFRSEEKFVKLTKRPAVLAGITIKMQTGCGDMYITVNYDTDGNIIEIIARLGKAGGCAASQADAVSALTTLVLRGKVNPEEIIKRLRSISCTQSDNDNVHSCSNAIAIVLEQAKNNKISPPSAK